MAPLPRITIQHFTHNHPLTKVYENKEFLCDGCKTLGSGTRYHDMTVILISINTAAPALRCFPLSCTQNTTSALPFATHKSPTKTFMPVMSVATWLKGFYTGASSVFFMCTLFAPNCLNMSSTWCIRIISWSCSLSTLVGAWFAKVCVRPGAIDVSSAPLIFALNVF